jgi:hypothetical protein
VPCVEASWVHQGERVARRGRALGRLPAFIDEHTTLPRRPFPLQSLEPGKLVAFEVMAAIDAALEPADGIGSLGKVDIIRSQFTGFRDSQTVAIDQQADQLIPMAVPVLLQCS